MNQAFVFAKGERTADKNMWAAAFRRHDDGWVRVRIGEIPESFVHLPDSDFIDLNIWVAGTTDSDWMTQEEALKLLERVSTPEIAASIRTQIGVAANPS